MRLALWPDSAEDEVDEVLALARCDGLVLVAAVDDDRLAGFAEFSLRTFADGCMTSPVAYLEGIWVDETVRRGRVASELVHEGEAWARTLGLTELASDCEIANDTSHAFHLGSGFQEVQRNICFRKILTSEATPPSTGAADR
jgi:aminoglycoside 6'-N-acetyltransferase I